MFLFLYFLFLFSFSSFFVSFSGCAGIPSFDYSSKLFLTLLFLLLAAALFAVACVARLCVRMARRTHRTDQTEQTDRTGAAAPGNLGKRAGGFDGPGQRADADGPGDGRAAAAHDLVDGLGRADSAGGDSLGGSLVDPQLGDPGSGPGPVSAPSPPSSLCERFRRLRSTAEWSDFAHRLQHCLLILGCIFFLRLTLLFFRGFRCVVAADPLVSTASNAAATQSLYLEEDLQTECWAGGHLQTMAVVLLLLAVYTAGLPAACFVMLMRSFADENTKGALGWLWARCAILRGPHCAAAAIGTSSKGGKRVASWGDSAGIHSPASGGIIGGGPIGGGGSLSGGRGAVTAANGKGVTVAVRADSELNVHAAVGSDFHPSAALSPTATAHPLLDSPSAPGRGSAGRAAMALAVSPRPGHRARLSSGGWSAAGAAATGEKVSVSAVGAAAEAAAAHSSESFSRAAAESVGPAGKYLRGAAAGPASAAAGAHPVSASLLSSSSSRFGYLFYSLRLSHFAFGLATFALHVWVAAVTVFVSDADPLLKLFLFGLAWAALTVATAVQLPYASLHDNARKVAIGMATLAHSAILLAAQSGGPRSAYLFLLLALFVLLVLALLFRRQIPLWAAACLGRSSPWRVRPFSSDGDDGLAEPQPAEESETAVAPGPASPAAAATGTDRVAPPHTAPSAPAADPSAERRGEFEKSAGKAGSVSSSSRGGSRIAAGQSAAPGARARPGSVSQSQSRSRSGRSEPQLRVGPAQAELVPAESAVAAEPEQGGALPGAVPEADGPTSAAACPSPSPSPSRPGSAAHSSRGPKGAAAIPVVSGSVAPLSTASSLSATPRLLALRPSALSPLPASAGRPLVALDDSLPLLPPLLATPPHGRAHEEPDDALAPPVAAAAAPVPSPLVSPPSSRSSSQSSLEVEVHGDAAVAMAVSAAPSRLQRVQPLRPPAAIRDAHPALAANEAASVEPADAAAGASAQPHQHQRRIQLPLLAKPSRIKQLTQLPPLKDGQQISAL